jgi:hypothetical protein
MEQYFLIPVAIFIISGLVYVFGFKKSEEPSFKKSPEKDSSKTQNTQKAKKKGSSNTKTGETKNNFEKLQDVTAKKLEKKEKTTEKEQKPAKKQNEKLVQKKTKSPLKSNKDNKQPTKHEKNAQTNTAVITKQSNVNNSNDDGWLEVTSKKNKKNDENNKNVSEKLDKSIKTDKSTKQMKNKALQKKINESKFVELIQSEEEPIISKLQVMPNKKNEFSKSNFSKNAKTNKKPAVENKLDAVESSINGNLYGNRKHAI